MVVGLGVLFLREIFAEFLIYEGVKQTCSSTAVVALAAWEGRVKLCVDNLFLPSGG